MTFLGHLETSLFIGEKFLHKIIFLIVTFFVLPENWIHDGQVPIFSFLKLSVASQDALRFFLLHHQLLSLLLKRFYFQLLVLEVEGLRFLRFRVIFVNQNPSF